LVEGDRARIRRDDAQRRGAHSEAAPALEQQLNRAPADAAILMAGGDHQPPQIVRLLRRVLVREDEAHGLSIRVDRPHPVLRDEVRFGDGKRVRRNESTEMAREGVPLIVIQRKLGHSNLGITSVYLQGIDSGEISETVHARRAPMIPVGASLRL